MSDILLWLTSYVLNAAWQVALLGAAGWVVSRCLCRTRPESQHKLWVATLILSTLVPATPIIESYFSGEALTAKARVSRSAMLASIPGYADSLTTVDIILPPHAIYLVSGLYIAVLLFFALRLCWMLYRTAVLMSNAGPASAEPEYVELWQRVKETLSVKTAALLCSREVTGAVTGGFRRPAVLLPTTFFGNHSPTEFLAAAAHECAHVKRHDFLKNVVYEITGLLTAFHPVTWFIKSRIAQTREMICDHVATELVDRRAYALSLLQLASKMAPPPRSAASHAVGIFDTDILEERIMTLTTSQPRLSRLQRFVTGGAATLLLSLCAVIGGAMTQSVAAQPATAQTDQAGKSRDLACTYYERGKGFPGTCGYDTKDKKSYRCYLDADPGRSQLQTGCEWKLRRALESQK